MTRLVLLTALVFSFFIAPQYVCAQNNNAPIPTRKSDALKGLNTFMQTVDKEKERSEEELKKIRQDVEQIRDELIKISSNVKNNEKKLTQLEREIKTLSTEKSELEDVLQTERAKMGNIVLAMQRIERIPTEVLIARPGAPIETAQTALLLQGSLPVIREDAKRITTSIERLNKIEDSLKESKKTEKAVTANLREEQKTIQSLFSKKEKLQNQLQQDIKDKEKALVRMAKEAENLQDLLDKIAKSNQYTKKSRQNSRMASAHRPVLPSLGDTQMPITGNILVGYRQKDDIGAVSQGIHIQGRSRSIIVAPMGGIVKFASPFKNYGQMVILSHKNNYYSLIAGFGEIHTSVGQTVKAGEPLGTLTRSSSRSDKPKLYYELRHKGKPVNPAKKISGLKS